MRLKEFQIKLLCEKILVNLRTNQLIHFVKGEPEARSLMEQIFEKELRVEDSLDAEVEKLLKQYEKQMGGDIDRDRMFQMIKKQLIKDKKVII